MFATKIEKKEATNSTLCEQSKRVSINDCRLRDKDNENIPVDIQWTKPYFELILNCDFWTLVGRVHRMNWMKCKTAGTKIVLNLAKTDIWNEDIELFEHR